MKIFHFHFHFPLFIVFSLVFFSFISHCSQSDPNHVTTQAQHPSTQQHPSTINHQPSTINHQPSPITQPSPPLPPRYRRRTIEAPSLAMCGRYYFPSRSFMEGRQGPNHRLCLSTLAASSGLRWKFTQTSPLSSRLESRAGQGR